MKSYPRRKWRSLSTGTRLLYLGALTSPLAGCTAKTTPPKAIQPVSVASPRKMTTGQSEVFAATIAAYAQAQLAFQSGGIVDFIHQVRGPGGGPTRNLEPGDPITKGEVLAHVQLATYQAKVNEAEAGVQAAQAQVASASASQADAAKNQVRAVNLFADASLTKTDADQAKATFDSANATVDQTKAGVNNYQGQLAEARIALTNASIRAPFAGVVDTRSIELGTLAGSSTAAFTVLDIHIVKALFAVPDIGLTDVHRGQKVPITIDGLPKPAIGSIISVSPEADSKSRVFSVEVALPNAAHKILPGMIGHLTLGGTPATNAQVYVIPLSAIVRQPGADGQFAVFLLDPKAANPTVHMQQVELGDVVGDDVVVRGGLSPQQTLVVTGSRLLTDGESVRITP